MWFSVTFSYTYINILIIFKQHCSLFPPTPEGPIPLPSYLTVLMIQWVSLRLLTGTWVPDQWLYLFHQSLVSYRSSGTDEGSVRSPTSWRNVVLGEDRISSIVQWPCHAWITASHSILSDLLDYKVLLRFCLCSFLNFGEADIDVPFRDEYSIVTYSQHQ